MTARQPFTSDVGQGRRWTIRKSDINQVVARLRAAHNQLPPARVEPPPRRPKAPKPARLVDAITSPLVAAKPERVIMPSPGRTAPPAMVMKGPITALVPRLAAAGAPMIQPAQGPIRGPASIVDVLARRNVHLALSADKQCIVVSASGGNLDLDSRQLIEQAAPLLVAHLKGDPLQCNARPHPGKGGPPPAVTLLVGGCPACAECLAGDEQ